jgi:hypothetical protein
MPRISPHRIVGDMHQDFSLSDVPRFVTNNNIGTMTNTQYPGEFSEAGACGREPHRALWNRDT